MSDRELRFPSPDESGDLTGDDARVHQRIAARLAALYAATPAPDAQAAERCARAVLTDVMHRRGRTVLGIPRTRWWWGAAAAAVLITVTARPWRGERSTGEADTAFSQAAAVAAASAAAAVPQGTVTTMDGGTVRFDLRLPTTAREVAIVGDFNGWNEDATPMASRDRSGTWSARIPLSPGRHVYAFVVDGKQWVVDPLAPQVPDDGFGPANAVVIDGATAAPVSPK